jgi:hypothetical protein
VDFQYNPWVAGATDNDSGHGGGIEAVLTGRSLSGDNLLLGRAMDAFDLMPILAQLRAKLPDKSSA